METQALPVTVRPASGTRSARQVRRGGQVPGILYGPGRSPVPVAVDARELERILQGAGAHVLVELVLNEDGSVRQPVLIKDVHRHPVSGVVRHVDFHAVALDREIETTVPIEAAGSPQGDGIVNLVLREVAVACLPAAIPDRLQVDVSGLSPGDAVAVRDVPVPPGVRIRHDADDVVLTIARPRVDRAAAAGEDAAMPQEPPGDDAAGTAEAERAGADDAGEEGAGDAKEG